MDALIYNVELRHPTVTSVDYFCWFDTDPPPDFGWIHKGFPALQDLRILEQSMFRLRDIPDSLPGETEFMRPWEDDYVASRADGGPDSHWITALSVGENLDGKDDRDYDPEADDGSSEDGSDADPDSDALSCMTVEEDGDEEQEEETASLDPDDPYKIFRRPSQFGY